MPKRKLSYPPKLVAELAVALRAVPGADGLVSVAYAFVEAMAKVRDKANTRNAAEA